MAERAQLESVVSRESEIRERWLPLADAAEAMVAFRQRFGERHFRLACHAAFPWIVTPELVNLIRINFLDGYDVPWIAEADFLLSPLCRLLGAGSYEVDPRVREVLLFKLESLHGIGRLTEMAEFLYGYSATPIANDQPPGTTQVQQWIALAYLAPEHLVSELTSSLQDSFTASSIDRQMAGQLRMAMASEIVAGPLEQALLPSEFADLQAGSRTIAYYWYGDHRAAFRRELSTAAPAAEPMSDAARQMALFIDWARATAPPPPITSDGAAPSPVLAAELELGLSQGGDPGFTLTLRFTVPDSDTMSSFVSDVPISLDFGALAQLEGDPEQYGRLLSRALFADPRVREHLVSAMISEFPLRLRILIGPRTSKLRDVRWETLRHPDSDVPLASSERIFFSRFLSNSELPPVRVRARSPAPALVAVANPTFLSNPDPVQGFLPPVDVTWEEMRVMDALLPANPVTRVFPPVTLDALVEQLITLQPDILYLVCHLGQQGSEPVLYLQNADGGSAIVTARRFGERLQTLERAPRLLVLASPRSPGGVPEAESGVSPATFGARLATAGVPAVVVVPGALSVATIDRFLPVLFSELLRDGQVDRAMTVARGAIRDRPDWWMPLLYLRVRSGRLWHEPGFAGDEAERTADDAEFAAWPALLDAIREGRCAPILGPGLTVGLFGSRREIVQRLIDRFEYPVAPRERPDLSLVAQFVADRQDRQISTMAYLEELHQALLKRFGAAMSPEFADSAELSRVVSAAGRELRESDPAEPHRVLAGLPFSVYITTNPDNLLADALREVGKDPQVQLFRWRNDPSIDWPFWAFGAVDAFFDPTPVRPLVFHLFGHLDYPDTLALTTDDLDQFLIAAGEHRDQIPPVVRAALYANALLILGFDLDSRHAQVLKFGFLRQPSAGTSGRFTHVIQQIASEAVRVLVEDAARTYLDFTAGSDATEIYWGSVADFSRDLLAGSKPPG